MSFSAVIRSQMPQQTPLDILWIYAYLCFLDGGVRDYHVRHFHSVRKSLLEGVMRLDNHLRQNQERPIFSSCGKRKNHKKGKTNFVYPRRIQCNYSKCYQKFEKEDWMLSLPTILWGDHDCTPTFFGCLL